MVLVCLGDGVRITTTQFDARTSLNNPKHVFLPFCMQIKVWCYECQAYVDHAPLWQFESSKVGRNVPGQQLQEPVVDLLATGRRTPTHIKCILTRKRLPHWFNFYWYWLCIEYPRFTLFSCKFLKRVHFCQSSMCNCGQPHKTRHFIE